MFNQLVDNLSLFWLMANGMTWKFRDIFDTMHSCTTALSLPNWILERGWRETNCVIFLSRSRVIGSRVLGLCWIDLLWWPVVRDKHIWAEVILHHVSRRDCGSAIRKLNGFGGGLELAYWQQLTCVHVILCSSSYSTETLAMGDTAGSSSAQVVPNRDAQRHNSRISYLNPDRPTWFRGLDGLHE